MKKSIYVRPLVEVTKLAEDIITASGVSLKTNMGTANEEKLGSITVGNIH